MNKYSVKFRVEIKIGRVFDKSYTFLIMVKFNGKFSERY